ncbi:hypothetical protein RCL1_004735 [Eukaryota sp. TZLM3-RCL]
MFLDKVSVSPLVVCSALDHHTRRDLDAPYAVGLLVGHFFGGEVSLTNSFPLPHFSPLDVFLSLVLPDSRQDGVKVRPPTTRVEQFLGLYCTSSDSSSLIESLSSFLSQQDIPLLLCIDTSLSNDQISVKALLKSGSAELSYSEIPCSTKISDQDVVPLNVVALSSLNNEAISTCTSTSEIQKDLEVLKNYLQNSEADEEIVQEIKNLFNSFSDFTRKNNEPEIRQLAILGQFAKEIKNRTRIVEQRLRTY